MFNVYFVFFLVLYFCGFRGEILGQGFYFERGLAI